MSILLLDWGRMAGILNQSSTTKFDQPLVRGRTSTVLTIRHAMLTTLDPCLLLPDAAVCSLNVSEIVTGRV